MDLSSTIIVRRGGATTTLATNITVLLVDSSGAPIVPDAPPVASIYRINPSSGFLALDIAMGTAGLVTLANLFATSGFWGAPLFLGPALFEHYIILVNFTVAAAQRRVALRLFISDDLKTIEDGSVTTPISRRTYVAT